MARTRMIKPGFFLNEQLADIPPFGRLLFAGLWCVADREGRLEDRPRRIKTEVLPYDDGVDVDGLLTLLHNAGFIARYTGSDGQHYIQVTNFTKHQTPHSREQASVIPAPTQDVTKHDLGRDIAEPRSPKYRIQNTDTDTDTEYRENGTVEVKTTVDVAPVAHATARSPSRKTKKEPPKERPRNEIWDAVAAAIGYEPKTRTEQSNWGKVCAELKEAGATPEEVSVRTARYIKRYGRGMLTVNALHNHWSECAIDIPIAQNGFSPNGGLSSGEAVKIATQEREALIQKREAEQRRLYDEKMRLYHDETALGS